MRGRTPLFAEVSRLVRKAHTQNREGEGLSRRGFLRGAAGVGLGAAGFLATPGVAAASGGPAITIVGGGIAGLNAAWYLDRAGLRSTVYEGSNRVGGRMWTGRGVVGPQLVTELGAEFIDSGHDEMRRLVRRFGLSLVDTQTPAEKRLSKVYHFAGRDWTEQQIVDRFKPVARAIAADQDAVDFTDYQDHNRRAREIDTLSLRDYLGSVGATGFIRDLLDVAYLTEYGRETSDQSALNLVFLLGTDTSGGFEEFGESDQRYKVAGGNDQVTTALAAALPRGVETGHRLVAVRPRGRGYTCTFLVDNSYRDVHSDVLLLTIPFSTLRDVDIQVPLPARIRRYIDECGYGTNSKLVLGFDRRYWRDDDRNGLFFTDLAIQSGWDSSQLQPGTHGSLTVFTGGRAGLAMAEGTVTHQRDRALPHLDRVHPGATRHDTGKAFRFTWPTHPWTKGSYTCFTPGQYTTFSGAAKPVGSLHFAGEHTNFDYQGYMEGGAVSGKQAAQAIVAAATTAQPAA